MQAVAIEKPQTKIRRASTQKVEANEQLSFREWLAEEAAAGRIIAPKNKKRSTKPEMPEPGLDWWSAYEYSRTDRF